MARQPLPFGTAAGPGWSFAHRVGRWDFMSADTTRGVAVEAVEREIFGSSPSNPKASPN